LVLLTLEGSAAGVLFRLLLRRLSSNLPRPHPLPLGYELTAAIYINGPAIVLCLYGNHVVQLSPPDVCMLWGALLAVLLFATPFLDTGTKRR